MTKVEDCYVVFETNNGWGYEIPLHDLKTNDGLQKWLDHMSCKNWFTDYMADELISISENKYGFKFNGKFERRL